MSRQSRLSLRTLAEAEAELAQAQRHFSDREAELQAEIQRAGALTHQLQAQLDQANHQLVFERNEIGRLNAAVSEKSVLLFGMRRSWERRMTAPLRHLNGLWRSRVLGTTRLDLVPVQHLAAVEGGRGERWTSTGNDPQFLLHVRNPSVLRRGKWFSLEFTFDCGTPSIQQVFINCGQGFQQHLTITFHTQPGDGRVKIPLYLPNGFKGLRLDPTTEVGEFTIKDVLVRQSSKPLTVAAEHDGVISYLPRQDAAGYALQPLHQLALDTTQALHWCATGEDPYFRLEFDDPRHTQPGWHRVQLTIRTEKPRGLAKFYLDTGSGFNENQTTVLPFESGQPMERVFYTTDSVVAVRFDPLDRPGRFRVEALSFEPVEERSALKLMAQRLAAEHEIYAGRSVDDVLKAVANPLGGSGGQLALAMLRLYGDTFDPRHAAVDYSEWIEQVEKPGLPGPHEVAAVLAAMARKPKVSVVMPTYNTPEAYLRKCIESVQAQWYPDWELCIADDASPQPHVRRILQEYAQQDARIKLVLRQANGHISRASNSALKVATGDYVALLDHDDELPPHALYFVAQAINANPDAGVVYSDEDKIDHRGRRFEPHFKSDWNPDLFLSQNYVSHLGVFRRDLLTRIGGFRPGVEGSQDQDLLLRCLPHLKPTDIVHVPRVLYHWRTVEGSTALASGEKSYTTEAGIKSLTDYFDSIGATGVSVERGLVPNTYRVRYPIPEPAPLVSLLIPTRDRRSLTETCVRSILDKTTYTHFEILILDNGSVEAETLEFFEAIQKEDPRVRVLRYDHPFNYSGINNFGERHAQGEVIGLVNNDIEVISPEWLTEMVSHAMRPEIGCVGAKLYYSNDTVQHAGVILGIGGVANHSQKHFKRDSPGYFARLVTVQNYSAVTAACLLVRRSIYQRVGGLNDSALQIAFNDIDFCLKVAEAGYRNLWTPYAELYHYESISRGTEDTPEKQARFLSEVHFMERVWPHRLHADPYYNPNLSKVKEDFSLGAVE